MSDIQDRCHYIVAVPYLVPKTVSPARKFDMLESKTTFMFIFHVCKYRAYHWLNQPSSLSTTHLMQISPQMIDN